MLQYFPRSVSDPVEDSMRFWLVALISLAILPLAICLVRYASPACTGACNEIPIALGWSAPRPVWLSHQQWIYQYEATRLSQIHRPTGRSPASVSLPKNAHGLSLILRDDLMMH